MRGTCYNKFTISGNPLNQHPAVPVEDVHWLGEFMNERPTVPFTTALAALKQKLFPVNYEPCEWIDGKQITYNVLNVSFLDSPTTCKCILKFLSCHPRP